MKATIIFIIFIIIITATAPLVTAQSATSSDLQSDVIVECVTFTPSGGYGRWPNNVEGGTFTGTCSAKTRCDIVTCLPGAGCVPNTGFVQLDSGNNFFSPGEINETGQLNNVKDHTGYYLYAAHTPEPLGRGADGENTTQQQGQAALVFPGGAENCTQIYWDPYGRVFDSVSLEPFGTGQATVTLLDENGNPSLNTFTNNVLTDQMGKYNIRINKDGNYKLNVTPKTNHTFTASMPDVKYKNLYDFIYKLGDPAFVEIAKNPKRVDIALKPVGAPYSRSPDYISREYLDVWFEGESYTKIALRTVHPKTIVKVMVNGIELTEDGAGRPLPKTSDKEGYWLALIKKEVLSQEGFIIELIKNPQYYPLAKGTLLNNISNYLGLRPFVARTYYLSERPKNNSYLTQLIDKLFSILFKKVSAQQSIRIDDSPDKKVTVIKFEPILDYIEGFAGIPKAKIDVRLQMNKQIYFSTVADDTGFFTIYPSNLPPYEFYLEFTDPETQKIVTQKTSEFVKQNKEYIKSENLNLIQAEKKNQNEKSLFESPISNKTVSNPAKTSTSLFNPAIMIILLIILLLVAATIGLVLYIRAHP